MTVRVFKLVTGEQLISKTTDTSEGYKLDKPAEIQLQQTDKGVGVGIAPYMPYASGDVILHRTAIVSEGLPEVHMENEYSRIFGSGIQLTTVNSLTR
jgi:hypothetical protein